MRIGLFFAALCSVSLTYAQSTYQINANIPAPKVYSGHLDLGGSNPGGEKIAVNNYYISVGGKPLIPITGEFHFSRYPRAYWEESIKKMKAGGINVIATYVFWNLHEEQEGRFVWTGDKDLKYFIELCRKNDIYAIVRIGPFCHGEIRNGGYPDWLLGRPVNIRSNDPGYLFYVERLYNEIGGQLKGLLYKDGGPVIGIQIENEYQHSAAPWGLTYPGQPLDMTAADRDLNVIQEGVGVASGQNPYADLGNDHMKVLKSLAIKAGMVVPLYTATGWGYAAIIPNGSLPVTAAYAYPFWTPKRDISPFFLYKDLHAIPDYSPVRYKPEDYPAFAAELGSGIMSVYTRRPVAVHKSFDALINRCIGSGANGIGYYMYHGGSTPKGGSFYMNDEAYGLPKISYDFQAPIGEFGQLREGFHRLKLLHFFLQDFGDQLAPMVTVLPENAASLQPENITALRYAVRIKDNSGFLFLNNFQDDTTMLPQTNIQVKVQTPGGIVAIPASGGFSLPGGENAVFPFNLDLNGALLRYATAQLMMKGNGPSPYYVFFTPDGVKGECLFAAGVRVKAGAGAKIISTPNGTRVECTDRVASFTVSAGGKTADVLIIDKTRALTAYVMNIAGKRHVAFSSAVILQNSGSFELLQDNVGQFGLSFYPRLKAPPKLENGSITPVNGLAVFSNFQVTLPTAKAAISVRQISEKKFVVTLPDTLPAGVNDLRLNIPYIGDSGMGFINGELVTDEFYKGIPWEIGLRKFLTSSPKPSEMVLYFRPMQKNASYLVDLQPYPQSIPDFRDQHTYLKVDTVTLSAEYKTILRFQ